MGDLEGRKKFQYIEFNLLGSTEIQEGQMAWDPDNGTLTLGMPGGNVKLQLGQEQLIRAKATGSATNNGKAVFISGATGAVVEMSLANASDFENACRTIAIATEDIVQNNLGYYTTFGIVRGIKTDYPTWAEGDILYLDSTDGGLTNVKPSAPNCIVEIGYVLRVHATEGDIFINIENKNDEVVRSVTKEPTGFTSPENVIVTYDSSARTIALTGTVNAYWRGVPVAVLDNTWVSDPHPVTLDKAYFLSYNGTDIVWSETPFDFSHVMIAFVNYGTNDKWALREVHGLMPWQSHREDHNVIGTYRLSGGTLGDFTLASTTPADRRPSVALTNVFDEDLPTTNPLLAANGPYTQFDLSGAGATINFDTAALDIVPLSTNQPFFNEFTGGVWQQTLMSVSNYMSIWLMAIPNTSDIDSQKYRYVWVQGQEQNSSLVGEQLLTVNDLNLSDFQGLATEFVFISRLIIRFIGGNWQIIEVENLTGTRLSQGSNPAGNTIFWGNTRNGDNGIGLTHTIGASAASGVQSFKTTVDNTQSNALDVVEIDLGSSAVGHSGLKINAQGASSAQKAIEIDMGAGIGDGIVLSYSGAAEGFKVISTSSSSASAAFSYVGGNVEPLAGHAFEVSGSALNNHQFRIFEADSTATKITTARALSAFDIKMNRIKNSGGATVSDNYSMVVFERQSSTSDSAGASVFNAAGAVVEIKNRTDQDTGTLNDSVNLLELVQDTLSSGIPTGFPISITQNAVVSTNFRKVETETNTGVIRWYGDGTDPNGALSGTAGDFLINGNLNRPSYCLGGTNWLDTSINLGDIDGFVVKYSSTTAVAITSGFVEVNGKLYKLSSDTTHTLTSLASGTDFHYIYIDDDASTTPTAVIIDSTDEPGWSDSKRGWYNGDDRCIGVVYSPDASATILYFGTEIMSDKNIAYNIDGIAIAMATNFNPNNTWQTPTVDGDMVTPVNAIAFHGRVEGRDLPTTYVEAYLTSKEDADSLSSGGFRSVAGYGIVTNVGWIPLGPSRQVRIRGQDLDDNSLSLWGSGWRIRR